MRVLCLYAWFKNNINYINYNINSDIYNINNNIFNINNNIKLVWFKFL
jgi:hypothetical protein